MSPITLSAPASQTFHPTPQRKGVRFGRDVEPETPKGPETDKVEINQTAETAPTEGVNNSDANESKTPEAPKTPEKPTFFKQLGERLSKFFKRIGKAFQKLFAPAKPQTELDRELKKSQDFLKQIFKHVRKAADPELVYAHLKEMAEDEQFAKAVEEKGLPEDKEEFAKLLKAAKTDEGLKNYIANKQKSAAERLHSFNDPQQLVNMLIEMAESHAVPATKHAVVQTEEKAETKPESKES